MANIALARWEYPISSCHSFIRAKSFRISGEDAFMLKTWIQHAERSQLIMQSTIFSFRILEHIFLRQ
jgi:hypothetical protein